MKRLLLALVLVFSLATTVQAADVSFSWTPNESNTTGYKIHYGTESGVYTQTVDVGMPEGDMIGTVTEIPEGIQYFYAATAYNPTEESEYSEEVTYTVPWGTPGVPQGLQCTGQTIIININ